jgi:hypothetical protein
MELKRIIEEIKAEFEKKCAEEKITCLSIVDIRNVLYEYLNKYLNKNP